jgi:hypothetical protein
MLVRTYTEALRVQGVQRIAQLGRCHNFALAHPLLLASLPFLVIKLAEEVRKACHHVVALQALNSLDC